MSVDPAAVGGPNLVERIKNILLTPRAEWDRIAGEPADISRLYMGYVLPLAALSALCAFIGFSVIGYSAFGVAVKLPIVSGLVTAAIQVVMALAGVYVLALITNALAPTFGSTPDQGQAHKLAVYGSTASFLAGVFTLLPQFAMLSILGLYSLVLIFIGLPHLMKTPDDKRLGYIVTIIIASIVVSLVMGAVLGAVRASVNGFGAMPGFSMGQMHRQASAPATSPQGQITLPGGGSVDLSELERMGQAFSNGDAGGGTPAVDPSRLQAQLPQSLPGGYTLVSASSGSAMGTSQAEGAYQNGDARMNVTIVQLGAMAGLAGMAGAMNVQQNRQDADGYARTQTVDGRMVIEEVSASANSAKYGIVGRGVAVTADGHGGATIDQARAAVETIGVARLEQEFGK